MTPEDERWLLDLATVFGVMRRLMVDELKKNFPPDDSNYDFADLLRDHPDLRPLLQSALVSECIRATLLNVEGGAL